ncbi:hypothetical protein I79_024273 [Cricetulus griseus]|uniref:Uncharacterized protein n=1 Tax=Cricetulus griseus TaxID=10029 RepID=G3IK78_CRIGR|nr:hypothetical protein I79_024273 [Cricetulus griseus]
MHWTSRHIPSVPQIITCDLYAWPPAHRIHARRFVSMVILSPIKLMIKVNHYTALELQSHHKNQPEHWKK